MDTPEKRRRYCPTPGWLVYGSLAVTGLLFASERWRWFWFNDHKGWTVLIAVAGVGVVLMVTAVLWAVALLLRWRFQFGIRTLFVLTVAVALPCSWLGVKMKKAKEQREAVREVLRAEGFLKYDYEVDASGRWRTNPQVPKPIWLPRLFGDDFFCDAIAIVFHESQREPEQRAGQAAATMEAAELIQIIPKVTDADLAMYPQNFPLLRKLTLSDTNITYAGLKHLRGLTNLKELYFYHKNALTIPEAEQLGQLHQLEELDLSYMQLTDAELQYLGGLTDLRSLDLFNVQGITDVGLTHLKGMTRLKSLNLLQSHAITDVGLKYIEGLTELESLDLMDTRVTDAGLIHLKNLSRLTVLNLNRTGVTDAGLVHLKGFANLRELNLGCTNVTGNGIKELRQALSECEISY